ncbi:MAG TPA: helix-turn-helix transcriptional regulator [Bryobacteraceae bacterium]|nr:helix-turn-helix transcriptional regulator [Bryobacteraceae bacterium]
MESYTANGKITFGVLQARLIVFVNNRIKNGDFTERGLARILGISQPQLHNVLKGARKLNTELADRLLGKFGIDVRDLIQPPEDLPGMQDVVKMAIPARAIRKPMKTSTMRSPVTERAG